jgi:hypothetical protein
MYMHRTRSVLRRAAPRGLVLLAVAVAACHRQGGAGRIANVEASAVHVERADGDAYDDHPPGRSDCPWVATGCPDNDGCDEAPDGRGPVIVRPGGVPAEISRACGPSAPLAVTFAEVARELREKPDLTTLRVIAPAADCARAVREALELEGQATGRIESAVVPGERYVQFEVAVWKGVSCK